MTVSGPKDLLRVKLSAKDHLVLSLPAYTAFPALAVVTHRVKAVSMLFQLVPRLTQSLRCEHAGNLRVRVFLCQVRVRLHRVLVVGVLVVMRRPFMGVARYRVDLVLVGWRLRVDMVMLMRRQGVVMLGYRMVVRSHLVPVLSQRVFVG